MILEEKNGDKGHIKRTSNINENVSYISSAGWQYKGRVKLSNIRVVEGTEEFVSSNQIVSNTKNHTLTAQWQKN